MSEAPITIITGASRGIGAATARLLARQGHDLAISYHRQAEQAETVADELRALGRRILVRRVDLASEEDLVALFQAVDEELGRLTGLVNNAAHLELQSRVRDMEAARIERMLQANVVGTFIACREAVRRLSTAEGGRGGSIVNVGSLASRTGSAGEYVDYAAAKGAIDSLTLGLAREVVGEGIRVNCVRPGPCDTEIHAAGGEPGRLARLAPGIPMRRGGEAEEVAEAIAWLLSDKASYTTASFIEVAGGL